MSGKSYFSLNFGDGTSIRDDSNNELLTFDVNGGAANNLQITNNASGSNVSIDVIGDDTDIGLNLNPKGHGKINVLGSTSNTGGIRLYSAGATDDSNHVGLTVSSSLAEDITFTLPTSDGTSGQVLQTDGSGALSFTDAGSGTPAGSDTHIQFNDGGSFGSSGDLIWNDTNIVLGTNNGIAFVDANEKISGDGSNLTVNSGRSILLTATSNVIIPSSVPLSFANDDAENITGDGTDLTVTSGGKINLTAGSSVDVPSQIPIQFGSSDVQMQKINAVEGLFNANLSISTTGTGIDLAPSGNVYISGTHLVLSHEIVSTAPSTYWPRYNITLFNLSSGGTPDNVDVSGNPVSQGASWHVLYDNTGDTNTTLRINFGSSGLVSGSGTAQYLTFSTTGQSASLIYLGGKWRIINTGAAVS